jgi:hypothetical protein
MDRKRDVKCAAAIEIFDLTVVDHRPDHRATGRQNTRNSRYYWAVTFPGVFRGED